MKEDREISLVDVEIVLWLTVWTGASTDVDEKLALRSFPFTQYLAVCLW